MGTTPHVCDLRPVAPETDTEVEAFFATLRKEQARFLGAMRDASSRLRRESGHLAHVAATQSRLTQQLFDAQRAIMLRQAEVDAEVLLIGRRAEEHAREVLAQTGDNLSTHAEADPAGASELFPVVASGAPRSTRQEIAALGVTVVRTMADVDSLERVINEAFEPDEPNGVVAQRQLESLLDEWWTAGNQDGLALIDDAHARACMRVHVARIGAGIETTREPAVTTPPAAVAPVGRLPLLPPPILNALRSADSGDLGSVLLSLSDLLDPSPEERGIDASAELTCSNPPTDAPTEQETGAAAESDESFKKFWAKGTYATASRRSVGAIRAEVSVSILAAMSLLASLAAWIG